MGGLKNLMSLVKREDIAVGRVTGLRAQTLEFEQEKQGGSSWLFLVILSDPLSSAGIWFIVMTDRPTKMHTVHIR